MQWHLPLLTCVLAACSTPYQTMGFMGGVESQQITSATYRIVARGNGYTGGTTIQDYTLKRYNQAGLMQQYQTLRSVSDNHVHVICVEEES